MPIDNACCIDSFIHLKTKGKTMRRTFIITLMLAALTGVAQSALAQSQAPSTSTTPAAKNDYSNGETWVCRPGRQDACAVDMTTTVVAANGKLTRETWAADPKAPVDC